MQTRVALQESGSRRAESSLRHALNPAGLSIIRDQIKKFQKSVDTLLASHLAIRNYLLGFTAEGNNSASSMKKKSTSKSAFFNLRILTASAFCLLGIAVALFAQGNRTKSVQQNNRPNRTQDAPGTQRPDVVQMVGPVRLNQDLRKLPYVPPKEESDERVLTRYPHGTGAPPAARPPPRHGCKG